MCFSVRKQEIVALCGPNGSGKSTLIEHLNGLLLPTEGSIWVTGRIIGEGKQQDLWRDVGVVFQRSEDQLFAPTVLDDVMFGPLNLGLSVSEAKEAAMQALIATRADHLVDKLPSYLSGGQKRLVSIAGILAMKPRIVALDEPTSDLDPLHARIIEDVICNLRNQFGISVVIATHDMDLAARIADRVCLVKQGSVFAEGEPEEVFYNNDLIAEAGLMLPEMVNTYFSYCQRKGITPTERPITREDLIRCLLPIHLT
jgi:cobalt/nickel transport system ATP-binding protein